MPISRSSSVITEMKRLLASSCSNHATTLASALPSPAFRNSEITLVSSRKIN
jgi:hypothetical protein